MPLALVLCTVIAVLRYAEPWLAIFPSAVIVLLYLIFRDPIRDVPSVALGVVSPVDGKVVEVLDLEKGVLDVAAHKIVIAVDSWGTYTARSPVEGKIMNLGQSALWVKTDEGDDVVLTFSGYRFGLPPRSFARFGERLGQGQRCAYLRLARFAEVQIPIDGTVAVAVGDDVLAGTDILGSVPNPR